MPASSKGKSTYTRLAVGIFAIPGRYRDIIERTNMQRTANGREIITPNTDSSRRNLHALPLEPNAAANLSEWQVFRHLLDCGVTINDADLAYGFAFHWLNHHDNASALHDAFFAGIDSRRHAALQTVGVPVPLRTQGGGRWWHPSPEDAERIRVMIHLERAQGVECWDSPEWLLVESSALYSTNIRSRPPPANPPAPNLRTTAVFQELNAPQQSTSGSSNPTAPSPSMITIVESSSSSSNPEIIVGNLNLLAGHAGPPASAPPVRIMNSLFSGLSVQPQPSQETQVPAPTTTAVGTSIPPPLPNPESSGLTIPGLPLNGGGPTLSTVFPSNDGDNVAIVDLTDNDIVMGTGTELDNISVNSTPRPSGAGGEGRNISPQTIAVEEGSSNPPKSVDITVDADDLSGLPALPESPPSTGEQ